MRRKSCLLTTLLIANVLVMPIQGLQSFSQSIPSYGVIKERIFIGVYAHAWDERTPYFEVNKYFDLMKDAGLRWIMVDVTHPYSSWAVETFNLFIEETHKRGIKILGILGDLVVKEEPFTLADWENYVGKAVEVWGDRVDAWEVWDEPNQFILGYADGTPEHYMDMLRTAFQIIKANYPEVPLIFGSLAASPDCADFAGTCWELGAASYCDAIGFNLENTSEDPRLASVALATDPMPLWVSSIINSLEYGLEGQAEQLTVFDTYLKKNAEKYRIQKAFWYCWVDYAKLGDETNCFGHPTSGGDFYGLVTIDLNPKPAYSRYQSL